MKQSTPSGSVRKRRILASAFVLFVLGLAGGIFLFQGRVVHDGAVGPDDEIRLAAASGEMPEPEEEGYERISDEEYLRRAAASPDQARVGKRFAQSPADKDRGAPAGLDWHSVGPRPFTEEYWSGDDDASGRVCALLVDPDDPDIVYAAGAQGGVWKTTDAGMNWTPLTDDLSSLASGALAFDPNDSDIIYYGTGEQHFSGDSFYGDGLFRSTDAGATWTKIAAKVDVGSYISRVAVAPDDDQTLYVGSELGFVLSTDGGQTWSVSLGPGYCTDIVVDPVNVGVVYCGFRYSGVWKSTAYGTGWSHLSNGIPTSGFSRLNIAMAASNPLVIYAALATSSGTLHGMYKTADGGANWSQLTTAPDYLGGQGNYDNCIIVDPTDPDICYAGGTFPFSGAGDYGLVTTTDGGATWTDINVGVDGSQPHPDHHIFAWGSNGRLWLGNDGGVWYTDDGGLHWVNCNATLSLGQIYSNAIHPTNADFLLGGTQDNGSARYDGVEAWPQVSAGDGGPSAVEWDSPNIYYTSYVQLRSLYKYDNGVYQGNVVGSWSGDRASWCNAPLVVDQNRADTILAGTHRVWRTTDSCDSWSSISGDLTNGGYLRAIAVADGATNTIYATSSDGLVHVTTDATLWAPRSTGLPSAAIPDIILSPTDWQVAYLCADQTSGGRVFMTDDAGVTWTDISGDLPAGLRGMCLAGDTRTTPPRLYLGTDYGVYASFDEGTTWTKADQDLPNLAVYDLTVDEVNSLLIAGTHGRGMWRAYLDVTGPVVTLTSPVGGEVWDLDSEYDITWTTSDDTGVESVSILLSRDGGITYSEVLADGIADTGSFTWTATAPLSDLCRVKVVALDASTNTGSGVSAADFQVRELSGIGDQDTPSRTVLGAAHPNPFNPSTTISFSLARDANARLQVFSVDGRLISTLVDAALPAGPHQAVWNGVDAQGRAVASGNYLYTLTTSDGFRENGKMSLVK